MLKKHQPKRIAVFCSANSEIESEFFALAKSLSEGLARRKFQLVYGGARVGLMGALADAMLEAGGIVRGAITESLAATREMPHKGIQELVVVKDLFDRKRWMMDHADAFVILPGGLGTLDEALEVITWRALKCHDKPILFVNIGGFWQSQLNVFAELEKRGMIRARVGGESRGEAQLYQVCNTLEEVWTVLDDIS